MTSQGRWAILLLWGFAGILAGPPGQIPLRAQTDEPVLEFPQEADLLLGGEIYEVRWSGFDGIEQVILDYRTGPEADWITVDPPNEGNSGRYSWPAPTVNSTHCRLRVRSSTDPNLAVESGGDFTLQIAGAVHGWGRATEGQIQPMAGDEFIAVAGGGYHSLALRLDGSLAGWGKNNQYQIDVPGGSDFQAVAAGYEHSLALKKDGTLAGWGNNQYSQANVPAGNDYTAVAAGGYHSLALRQDGTLAGWGKDTNGQATVPAGNDYDVVAAGWAHSIALKTNGAVVGWGYNGLGEIDIPPEAASGIKAISAGSHHNLALTQTGQIIAWGSNQNGQCDVPAGDGFVAIAAGGYHSLALQADGTIIGWGQNANQQCETPSHDDFVLPVAGYFHSLGLRLIGLSLAEPAGGEIFQAGEETTIRWRSRGAVGPVRIEYSTNEGGSYQTVQPANEGNRLQYTWQIPPVSSDLCLVRLRSELESQIGHVTPETFTIYQCLLSVDLTGDCRIDLLDLEQLVRFWLQEDTANPCPLPADLAGNDCLVNLADLAVLADYWLDCGNPFDPSCTTSH